MARSRQPYAETFVICSGRARFTVGNEQGIGVAGQIIVVPADTPHRFAMIGPEPLDMIDLHASDRLITTRLTGLQAAANPVRSYSPSCSFYSTE